MSLACSAPLEWVQLEEEAQSRAMSGAPWTRVLEPLVTKHLEDDREAFQTFVKLREPAVQRYIKGVEGGRESAETAAAKLDSDAVGSVYQSFALRHASWIWCAASDHGRRKASYQDRKLERIITRQISGMA